MRFYKSTFSTLTFQGKYSSIEGFPLKKKELYEKFEKIINSLKVNISLIKALI